MRDVVMVCCRRGHTLEDLLPEINSVLEAFVDPETTTADVWFDWSSSFAMVHLTPSNGRGEIKMHRVKRQRAFVYTGYVRPEWRDPATIAAKLAQREGRLVLDESPGGIAAYFLADTNHGQCFAWSSHAGVQSVFYTVGPRCIAISNRPLLSHVVGFETTRPTFSVRWAHQIVIAGSTLWDDTPYEGTRHIEPRSMIVVNADGRLEHRPHPVPLQRRSYPDGSKEAIDELAHESLGAASVLRGMPKAELRLSGGKDSRYVAAVLSRAGADVESVTYSETHAGEGPLARVVADHFGIPHRIGTMPIATPENVLATVYRNLRRSDGLLSENRQLVFGSLDRSDGQPFIDGQAHHPRGGYGIVMGDALKVRERMHGHCDGLRKLVVPELADERARRVDEIIDGWTLSHPAEAAYWMYSDYRMTRWINGSYLAGSRQRPYVWLCMDERVLSAISQISVYDRSSERAFYAAMIQIAKPGIERIPLYEDQWKFDRAGKDASPFPDGYEERNTPFVLPQEPGRGRASPERRLGLVWSTFRRLVLETKSGAAVAECVDPTVRAALLEGGAAHESLGLTHGVLVDFIWRITAASLVLEGEWLSPQPA
ncbi:hypothetical protein [Sandaracinus amylolyticus]|uniref:hypothetical protein n=1 Tax=Sandaracinus amylolyticus TaxID=927083 RepID=UPI001F387BE2|nr:hypothetical protein [Sandaracinus amylolyticus]UJR85282.1 Hypothetical protein I5071_73620 [Sandaracinus amylolyticus]